MPRMGRLIPAFGTMQSFRTNVQMLGATALERARFGTAAQRIVSAMSQELTNALVGQADCEELYASLYFPTALVWKPICGVGHAAVFIGHSSNGPDDTDRYASLFPGNDVDTGEAGAGPQHLLPGRKLEGTASSFLVDCLSEGDGTRFRKPEFVIQMKKLDRNAMVAKWISIRDKPDMHYRLMRKNCSTIAARVIRAGVSKSEVHLTAHKAWWTPYDVVTLAKAVA